MTAPTTDPLADYPALEGNLLLANGFGVCTPDGTPPLNGNPAAGYANFLAQMADGSINLKGPLNDRQFAKALENRFQSALLIPANGGRVDAALQVVLHGLTGDVDLTSPIVIAWANSKIPGTLETPAAATPTTSAHTESPTVAVAPVPSPAPAGTIAPPEPERTSVPQGHVEITNMPAAIVAQLPIGSVVSARTESGPVVVAVPHPDGGGLWYHIRAEMHSLAADVDAFYRRHFGHGI